jgi:predicted permease
MAWRLFRPQRRHARDRAEEMRAHLEDYADQLVARGLSPEAARREARLRFGNPRVKLEEVEAMGRFAFLEPLWRDLRYAVRSLRRTPGFTAVVVGVLALGIGTATAIFSVVDAVVVRGLPFDEPRELVSVSATRPSEESAPRAVPVPDALDYRALQDVFDGLAIAAGTGQTIIREGGHPEPVGSARMTADLLGVLGVAPQLGRPFSAEHEVAGSNVALISDGLWRRRFGGDPGVVGRRIETSLGVLEVLGVMPHGFAFPVDWSPDLWAPFVVPENQRVRASGGFGAVPLVGRLKEGITIAQAQARMEQIRRSLAAEDPAWFRDRGVLVRPLRTTVAGGDQVRAWLLMLLAAVGCVLLLACVNVANLLLARAITRLGENRIRAALGASRYQLVRSALAESLLLSIAGLALGILFAYWAVDVLRATIPTTVPLVSFAVVDLRILIVAGTATLVIGVLLGILPAIQAARLGLAVRLRQTERTHTSGANTHRARGLLLLAELSLAMLLLVGSGLFASSFIRVMNVDLGMDYRNVLTVPVHPTMVAELVPRLQSVAGVLAVGVVDQNDPLGGETTRYSLKVPGREAEFWDADAVHPHWVTPGFRDAMRLPLLKGRWLEPDDEKAGAPVAVLSSEAARRYFPNQDPLGMVVGMGGTQFRIVGVAGSIRLKGPEMDPLPQIYLPPTPDRERSGARLLIRTAEDPSTSSIIPTIKTVIWSVAPDLPLPSELETMASRVGTLVAPRRFNMVILTTFGVMGTIIAAIGIYGVMAYMVAQRTQEIGIRMALGAEPGRVRRSVLWQASRLLLLGHAIGLATAAALAKPLEGMLFQVRSRDVVVYAGAGLVLLAAGLGAAYLPARRASRVDPLIALRAE